MMKILYSVFALLITVASPLWAVVQTDTHTYIVSDVESAVLAINRATGEETLIPVGKRPWPMVIHGAKGYVVNWNSASVSVIDLNQNKILTTISVYTHPRPMVIHGNVGYVVNTTSGSISVIDLYSDCITQTLQTKHADSMVIHQDIGYFFGYHRIYTLDLKTQKRLKEHKLELNPNELKIHGDFGYIKSDLNFIQILDLKTMTIIEQLSFAWNNQGMIIHNTFGYVLNSSNNQIGIIDLQTHSLCKKISSGRMPVAMERHGNLGYICNSLSNSVSVLDLIKHEIVNVISVGKNPQTITLHMGIGYVLNLHAKTISAIDLSDHKVISTLENLNSSIEEDTITCSDKTIYVGLKKSGMHLSTREDILDFLKKLLEKGPSSAYGDLLSPAQIVSLLPKQDWELAIDMVLSLYQAVTLLDSPEGNIFLDSLPCPLVVRYRG